MKRLLAPVAISVCLLLTGCGEKEPTFTELQAFPGVELPEFTESQIVNCQADETGQLTTIHYPDVAPQEITEYLESDYPGVGYKGVKFRSTIPGSTKMIQVGNTTVQHLGTQCYATDRVNMRADRTLTITPMADTYGGTYLELLEGTNTWGCRDKEYQENKFAFDATIWADKKLKQFEQWLVSGKWKGTACAAAMGGLGADFDDVMEVCSGF